jgi:Flp pilus assembly protein TadG
MTRFTEAARGLAARLIKDRKGGVAALTAVALTALLGFAGLGTEVSLWYSTKRNMQGASDAAAFSAAAALASGANSTAFTSAAKAITKSFGFTDGAGGVTVTVHNPPATGAYTANLAAVEVDVQQRETMLFTQLFLTSAPTFNTRAVGLAGTSGNGCVMALDKGNVTDVTDSGGTTLNLTACSLYVNSPSSSALTMSGGAIINAQSAYIVGNYTTSGGAKLNTTSGTHTAAAVANDPYANVAIPSYSGCNKTNTSVSGGRTLNIAPGSPGGVTVLCGGLVASGGSTVNLSPGVYIIDGGNFNISGGSVVNGAGGVTIILTSSSKAAYGTVNISGGTTINITAPTSGTTAGLAFFQDRAAPSTSSDSFSGGTTQDITGAIYFPSQPVTYSGGATVSNGGAACTQLLAYKLSFSGGSTFNANCSGTGVAKIGASTTTLVE